MTFDPSAQPGAFDSGKPLTSDELLQLRSEVWADGSIALPEAERLLQMNRTVAPSKEWSDFFLDALSTFMLAQHEPRDYITEDDAGWLIAQMSGSDTPNRLEVELIVKLLEHAQYAPGSLRRFALALIEKVVLAGDGRVDDGDAALIRRLIFAPAGEGPAMVSQPEAEMLFRLKDASLGKDNSPEWKKLFVQGVANHLMAHQSYTPPSAEEELRLERPYESNPFGHVLSRLGDHIAGPRELRDSIFGPDQDAAIAKLNQATAADAEVTPEESHWLQSFYDRDGQRDEYEQALLDFLAEDRIRPF